MSREFVCRDCGRRMISVGNDALQATHPDLCAACWSMPGWYDNPEQARAIDPNDLRATTRTRH